MWEVMSYGERPYWDMSNQEVSMKKNVSWIVKEANVQNPWYSALIFIMV